MDILTSAEGPYIPAAEAMLFSFLSHNPGPHSVYLLSQEYPGRFRDIALLCDPPALASAISIRMPSYSVWRAPATESMP
jgi:hypothetical protein